MAHTDRFETMSASEKARNRRKAIKGYLQGRADKLRNKLADLPNNAKKRRMTREFGPLFHRTNAMA